MDCVNRVESVLQDAQSPMPPLSPPVSPTPPNQLAQSQEDALPSPGPQWHL